jgi:hypothetical protein
MTVSNDVDAVVLPTHFEKKSADCAISERSHAAPLLLLLLVPAAVVCLLLPCPAVAAVVPAPAVDSCVSAAATPPRLCRVRARTRSIGVSPFSGLVSTAGLALLP